MIVLDADSLMTGDTIVRLVHAMERHPRVGLIQTLPMIVNANTSVRRGFSNSPAGFMARSLPMGSAGGMAQKATTGATMRSFELGRLQMPPVCRHSADANPSAVPL